MALSPDQAEIITTIGVGLASLIATFTADQAPPAAPAILLALMLGASLSACTSTGGLTATGQTEITVTCNIANAAATAAPAALQITTLLDPSAAAAIATVSAVDQLAHPAIAAACAAVNGKPAAVAVPAAS